VNTRRLQAFLRRHSRVGIDTSPFIYAAEDHPTYSVPSAYVLRWIATGQSVGVTSTLTMTELLVLPYRDRSPEAADAMFSSAIQMPNIEWLSPSLSVADRAARARALYRLRTLDAIQIATAMAGLATGFITNDRAFQRVTDVDVLLLDELV
jgi:predicted nucleic acid-binding protein